MEYLFSQLEAEVNRVMSCPNTATSKTLACKPISDEIENQKRQLKEKFFEPWSSKEFQKFTELHLFKLSEILATIYEAKDSARELVKRSPSPVAFKQLLTFILVQHKLRYFLGFMYEVYGKYIPKDHCMPLISHRMFVKEVQGYQIKINKHLEHLDAPFVELVLKPFWNFCNPSACHTWHQLEYCRLMEESFTDYKMKIKELTREAVIRFLIKVNFNDADFYSYCTALIKRDKDYPSIPRLEDLRKEVGQIQVKKRMQYVRDMKSIQKQIQCWLKEEIQYWMALELDKEMKEQCEGGPADKPGVTAGKINTCLTESVLALKTSVELEAGLLYGKGHPQPVLKKTLETYHCSNRDQVSYESFRKRFYERNVETAKKLREHLLKCLRVTNNIITSRGGSLS